MDHGPRNRQPLPQWIEENVRLPAANAELGPIKLDPFQRGIGAAIGDPEIECVGVLKFASDVGAFFVVPRRTASACL
jgi:hypothetical protein